MIATLYKDRHGKAEFDIIATRDADITDASEALVAESTGPGSLRLLTAVRAGHLLEVAADRIRRTPENTADWFFYNSPDLGTVHVAWVAA